MLITIEALVILKLEPKWPNLHYDEKDWGDLGNIWSVYLLESRTSRGTTLYTARLASPERADLLSVASRDEILRHISVRKCRSAPGVDRIAKTGLKRLTSSAIGVPCYSEFRIESKIFPCRLGTRRSASSWYRSHVKIYSYYQATGR